jgi:hypothetical protein
MSYEICESCGKSGETDHDDGGAWDGRHYTCARCVKAQIAAEDVTGDPYEELLIKEREK